MPVSMYSVSVPVFMQHLNGLSAVLDKAAAHAAARKIDPAVLLATRLFPDMFALTRQVQLTCDFAKNTVARLAGQEPPKWPDEETSFEQLKARIAKTADFVRGFSAVQLEGAEGRDVTLPMGGKPTTFKGGQFLFNFALPNFYFHATTAYDLIRQCGVEVGKRDFMGTPPA